VNDFSVRDALSQQPAAQPPIRVTDVLLYWDTRNVALERHFAGWEVREMTLGRSGSPLKPLALW